MGSTSCPTQFWDLNFLFVGSQDHIRHLGILVGRDTEHCRQEMSKTIAASLERRVASWATTSLSNLGRTYVARQCMASKYTYHAAFVPLKQPFLWRTADLRSQKLALPRLLGKFKGDSTRMELWTSQQQCSCKVVCSST